MKYILVIGDGMADFPVEALGGRTPLEAAQKPTIDGLARRGIVSEVKTVPDGRARRQRHGHSLHLRLRPAQGLHGPLALEAAGSRRQDAAGQRLLPLQPGRGERKARRV